MKFYNKTTLTIITIIFFIVMSGTIFLSYYEKNIRVVNAEIEGKRVAFSVLNQNIISHSSKYSKEKQPKLINNPSANTKSVFSLGSRKSDGLKIGILITGLGLSQDITEKALAMPPEVGLGFSPYSYNLGDSITKAKLTNHESFIFFPLEPSNYPLDDPGPLALLEELSQDEIKARINTLLTLGDQLNGFYSLENEKFTGSVPGCKMLLDSSKKFKIPYIYGGSKGNSVIFEVSSQLGSKFLVGYEIDQILTEDAIKAELDKIEKSLSDNNYSIVVINPYPISTNLVLKWIESLSNKGIKLLSISDLYKEYLSEK